jgi:DNA-binding LacI/PurR family transcriptional regulator
VNWVNSKEVDGIIHYGTLDKDILRAVVGETLPIVAVSEDPSTGIPTVSIDDYSASYKITEYLVDKGHRSFLYIAGDISYISRERENGFRDALKKHGIPHGRNKSLRAYFSEDEAYEIVKKRVFSGNMDETAVVAANDYMAVGAIRALKDAGRKVPEEIAVVGGDNISIGCYMTPSLTTFDRRLMEIGQESFKLLYDIIKKERTYDTHLQLNADLVIRESA